MGPIRDWFQRNFSDPQVTGLAVVLASIFAVIWVAGDYGFDQGVDTAHDKPRDGGPMQVYTVKGILIYKRQKDGRWLVYRDIWNFNSEPKVCRD